MDPALLTLLAIAVFGASMLQAATGIGYGVIAGPVFLVALNGSEAIQISTIHNLLIALLLAPFLRGGIDKTVLALMAAASLGGIAAGFFLQFALDVAALKLAAAVMVAFVSCTLIADMRRTRRTAPRTAPPPAEILAAGAAAGVMGGMLAMPGPLAATWMSVRGFEKHAVRATILAFFIFAYGANLLVYSATSGFREDTLLLSLYLAPPLAAGIAAGSAVSRKLSERVFRWILLAVLVSTTALLLNSLR